MRLGLSNLSVTVSLMVITLSPAGLRAQSQKVRPIKSVKPFDNVRWKDMSELDLSGQPALPATLTFNEKTVWAKADKMPKGRSPRQLLRDAMNPGLGVRELQSEGITGKGVNVAIIDQPLYRGHPEFAGKIIAYHDVGCGSESSMHGPAVASLLVGTNCGVAPDARLYYVAAPSWTRDSAYQAKALDWIVEQNKKLGNAEKIRVVSVSAAPSGPGSPFEKNQSMWDSASDRAEAAGILILDCTQHHGFIGPCYYDATEPENVAKCRPGFPSRPSRLIGEVRQRASGEVLVPCSPRTVAEEYDRGQCSYQYCGQGGLSWSIPYCAGVLALGWQLRPDLSAEQMRDILVRSAYLGSVINPKEFVRMVKAAPARY